MIVDGFRRLCVPTVFVWPAIGLFLLPMLATPVLGAELTVNLVGDGFDPPSLTIEAGDTVRWVNDGGSNNVVESTGLFTSGNVSTILWDYSYLFHKGGSYTVVNERTGLTNTITVSGMFIDAFDFGHLGAWDRLEPVRSNCNCYFAFDCVSGEVCDYGPGGFETEDICSWVDVKPSGVPGAGCNLPHNGPWGGSICDGTCQPVRAGSSLGLEDRDLLRQGVSLWAEAVLAPAEAGGGPLQEDLVEEARQLAFSQPNSAQILGRQVANVLILTAGQELYEYFCHHDQHPEAPEPALWLDFSDQPCRLSMARLTIDALLAAFDRQDPMVALSELPAQCGEWADYVSARCAGPDPLACMAREIDDMAIFITTPAGS